MIHINLIESRLLLLFINIIYIIYVTTNCLSGDKLHDTVDHSAAVQVLGWRGQFCSISQKPTPPFLCALFSPSCSSCFMLSVTKLVQCTCTTCWGDHASSHTQALRVKPISIIVYVCAHTQMHACTAYLCCSICFQLVRWMTRSPLYSVGLWWNQKCSRHIRRNVMQRKSNTFMILYSMKDESCSEGKKGPNRN